MITKHEQWIYNCNKAICMNLDSAESFNRGFLSVNILSQLRNLVDHICVKIYASEGGHLVEKDYDNICEARKYVHSKGKYRFIKQLYDLLQISASHYTLDPENSERLMLKYYKYLLQIKKLMAVYGINILHNLYKFPLNTDPAFSTYYKTIANKIENLNLSNATTYEKRFYIYKVKPFFVEESIYYEITFSIANERASKFDRIIAFSKIEILPYYASYLRWVPTEIDVLGVKMPISIIVDWKPAIRICELKNFSKILGMDFPDSRTKEYDNLMNYLIIHRCSLVEAIDFDDYCFETFLSELQVGGTARHISSLLTSCRSIIKQGKEGSNVLRYLLLRMNNKIIKSQYDNNNCSRLSNLNLSIKCKPFDRMPFSFSLSNHNPMLSDLLDSIPTEGHESEFLARRLAGNAEHNGVLYTPLRELSAFTDVQALANEYNERLYRKHQHARIEILNGFVFIRKYEENVHCILHLLKGMCTKGISNYTGLTDAWLARQETTTIDCAEKRNALRYIFSDSQVAFIYGAAGTGKSTFINYLSNVFHGEDKLYLANTNPAVDNLRRKVKATNTRFMTIASFLGRHSIECDILFIDECSTVSNDDMLNILKRENFHLLVLVGDMFQIESIQFGNWFSISHFHFKGNNVINLTHPYRTSCPELLKTWKKVRELKPDILEYMTRNGYSSNLDESIFSKNESDEIILCLNYGGLYGINNINRFLQNCNLNFPVRWGVHTYKKGDPILFNETDRFSPFLYNNLKGEIVEILTEGNSIFFTLKVFTILSDFDLEDSDIDFVSTDPDGVSTIIRIRVDEDDDGDYDINSERGIIPFQIAYAVSIHKAQGLEYQSVKIVITHDVEDQITHNIFYTAITRTRKKLKIYWTPETEKKVFDNLKFQFNQRDYGIIKGKYNDF